MKIGQVAVVALGMSALFAACTRVEMADQPPPVAIDGGYGGEPHGGAGSVPGEGGSDGGALGIDAGGAPDSVALGIWPTSAAAAPDAQVAAVDASVAALSAGSLTLPLYERWSDLSGPTGSPRAVTWARLDAMVAPYADREADVALCVGVVDRQAEAWPVSSLEGDEAIEVMDRTIDEIFMRYSARLSHLCFGHELDRYFEVADAEQAEQLLALLEHAITYARRHPLKAARTSVGTSITLTALATAKDALLTQLLLGDEAVAVYDPLDADGALKEPDAISAELDAALATLARLADRPKPLALFEVGYPSAGATGATERAQRTYYEALFDTLDSHRSEVSFVGAYGLGDRSAADCEAEAPAFGDDGGVRPLVRCSMGLRADAEGEGAAPSPKLAWAVVSRALSAYR